MRIQCKNCQYISTVSEDILGKKTICSRCHQSWLPASEDEFLEKPKAFAWRLKQEGLTVRQIQKKMFQCGMEVEEVQQAFLQILQTLDVEEQKEWMRSFQQLEALYQVRYRRKSPTVFQTLSFWQKRVFCFCWCWLIFLFYFFILREHTHHLSLGDFISFIFAHAFIFLSWPAVVFLSNRLCFKISVILIEMFMSYVFLIFVVNTLQDFPKYFYSRMISFFIFLPLLLMTWILITQIILFSPKKIFNVKLKTLLVLGMLFSIILFVLTHLKINSFIWSFISIFGAPILLFILMKAVHDFMVWSYKKFSELRSSL